jgi:uncharacterized SAM-binding protein YcdF (DUF218 family)
MRNMKRAMIGTGAAGLWLLAFGFVVFASTAMREPDPNTGKADGIVVLTGGESRIVEAARLLKQGRAQRLLISGVNAQTRQQDLQRVSGLNEQQFNCCVDLGYTALDTVGNATEARTWAEARKFDSLIVVTSNYHMPRSLAELGLVLPNTRLIPHPVKPRTMASDAWWLNFTTTRNLVAEYLKFLPSAARLAMARALRPFENSSVAAAPQHPAPKT